MTTEVQHAHPRIQCPGIAHRHILTDGKHWNGRGGDATPAVWLEAQRESFPASTHPRHQPTSLCEHNCLQSRSNNWTTPRGITTVTRVEQRSQGHTFLFAVPSYPDLLASLIACATSLGFGRGTLSSSPTGSGSCAGPRAESVGALAGRCCSGSAPREVFHVFSCLKSTVNLRILRLHTLPAGSRGGMGTGQGDSAGDRSRMGVATARTHSFRRWAAETGRRLNVVQEMHFNLGRRKSRLTQDLVNRGS